MYSCRQVYVCMCVCMCVWAFMGLYGTLQKKFSFCDCNCVFVTK